jgi:uncharacterized protein
MTLPGVRFTASRPVAAEISSRADVAMFVGLVPRRPGAIPASLRESLVRGGWSPDGLFKTPAERLDALLGVPVAVASWSEFDALFAWDRRRAAPGSDEMLPTALGLAVRSFFDEGGAKAWITRTGDPPPLADPGRTPEQFATDKLALLDWARAEAPDDAEQRVPILPGLRGGRAADPADPASWRGAASVYAVPDAAMLLLPDLVDLCAGSPRPVPPVAEPAGPPERFKPCATAVAEPEPGPRAARPEYRAPRLDEAGYRQWSGALRHTLDLLGRPRGPAHRRDIMLIGALPLPLAEAGFDRGEEEWPLAILDRPGIPGAAPLRLLDEAAIGSARLQLAYPWVETAASSRLPEGLQSPEGLLAGMIARTSLADGAFRSAAGRPLRSPRRLHPPIGESDLARGLPEPRSDWLGERLCLIGTKRGRIELLSDSTLAVDRKWRAGGVSRLMGIILRGARFFGEDLLFEPSGPALWARIQASVESFLAGLWRGGAFDGRSRDQAFEVSCGEASMTPADIDSGRVICRIGFTAAYPIERIEVSLLLLEAERAQVREAA